MNLKSIAITVTMRMGRFVPRQAFLVGGEEKRILRFFKLKHAAGRICIVILLATTASVAIATSAMGEIIFESGTLGATGAFFSDLENGIVPGTNVNGSVFTGVRFKLSQRIITSHVGGHFVERISGTFFGAIVGLDDENDFPDSGDFSTPDVLGAATLAFPNPSAEAFGDLALSLDPGWYALVFGSGLFGTNGSGGAVRNGMDIGGPTYIGYQPGSGVSWIDITPDGPNHRFVVNGSVVPEPNTIQMTSLVLVVFLYFRLKTVLRKAPAFQFFSRDRYEHLSVIMESFLCKTANFSQESAHSAIGDL
jgi:hypothetical protein